MWAASDAGDHGGASKQGVSDSARATFGIELWVSDRARERGVAIGRGAWPGRDSARLKNDHCSQWAVAEHPAMTVSLHKVGDNTAPSAELDGGPEQVVEAAPAAAHSDSQRAANNDHHYYLAIVTRKLVTVTLISLAIVGVAFYGAQLLFRDRSFLVALVFAVGLIGGFVSLQQRLPKASVRDLRRLSETWFAILLVPINGGIFAIVLHVAFLGKILQGDLFPTYVAANATAAVSGAAAVTDWLKNIAPASSADLGKLLFWAFIAGFSERLVPQILQQHVSVAEREGRDKGPTPAQASPERPRGANPNKETP